MTGVNVTIQYPMQSSNEVPETVAYARKLVADLQASYPDYRFALSGLIMLNNAFAETGQKDMQTLVPVMYGVLIAATVLLLRSFVPSLVTLLIIALSTVVAMGAAGYLGIRLSPISATAPTIILTLAVADSLHILVPFLVDMRRGTAKKEALEKSLRINLVPISVTSLTTAIGFLTLNFAESPVFWHLGNISAIGILAGWLLSLTLLPALISLLPIRVKVREGRPDGVGRTLSSVATHMARHRRVVLGTAAVSVLVLVSIAPHMRLDDNFVKYFDHDIEFRRDTDYMLNNLTGIIRLEYSMPGAPGKGVNDPAYLEALDAFTQWLRSQDLVRHVYSYTDIVKRINMNMHGDDPDAYAVPENQALAAQYLLLYELSLPYGLSLNDRIALDRSASRVTVTMDDVSMYEVREFRRRAAEWMQANMPEAYRGQATGVAVMFSYISQRNIEGMLVGNAIGLVAISFLLLLMLRSLRLGVISLITNLVPIAVSFGIWALLVGEIGMAAASVAAIALGIIVDDTVHFLIKYLRARNEGMDDMEAVGYAAGTVGKAIMVITVVTIAGFVVLALSSFRINVQMGLLTAMTLSLGALFSFTVMPALLTIGYKARKETKDVEEAILEGGVRKLDLPPVSAADFDRAGSVGRSS